MTRLLRSAKLSVAFLSAIAMQDVFAQPAPAAAPLAIGETYATIYHPAALQAFRTVFKPAPAAAAP